MSRTDDAIRDQAYQFFEQESLELLQVLEDGLLTLRTQSDLPTVHGLMRAAHSIKGGAASVGLMGIKKIAHKLEDILRALYRREDPIDESLESALLQAYDCLRVPLQAQIETGQYDEVSAWETAEPIFSFLETILAKDLGAEIELPTAAELGIDIVSEVFSGDVQRELDRLENALQTPDLSPITGEVRATIDVFLGIGELLGLSGFMAIAQTALQALENNPHEGLAIGQAVLDDVRNAQALVLGGDREQGGSPSEILQALTQPNVQTLDPFAPPEVLPENWSDADLSQQTYAVADFSPEVTSGFGALEDLFGQTTGIEIDSGKDEGESIVPPSGYGNLEDLFGATELSPEFTFEAPSWDFAGSPEDAPLSSSETSVSEQQYPLADLASPVPIAPSEPSEPSARVIEVVSEAQDTTRQSTTPQIEATVRVDFLRLDRINNLVGELVTQENGAFLQTQELQTKLKALQRRFHAFDGLSKNLQTWMDESIKAGIGEKQGIPSAPPSKGLQSNNITDLEEFDPLLMDSYSGLYMMVQDALEEIAQMGETLRDMTLITQDAQNNQRKKQQTLKQVRNDLLWARMMPIGDILRRFPRMVRDLSTEQNKKVVLKQFGTTTPVDKVVLERLYDPLVHLIRNSFDHGTESPEERIAQGKPPEATIELRAFHRGNQTFIEIKDDGRGIDPEIIRAAAIRQGFLEEKAAASIPPEQLYDYLFESSFSTKTSVSDLSGRGMGLTAVKLQVEALKGKIAIASELGQGTTFTISLPLTLTIAKLLVFAVDGYYMAIPVDTLLAIISVDITELPVIQGRSFYRHEDKLIPLYPPSAFAHHYPLPKVVSNKKQAIPVSQGDKIPLLVIANGKDLLALEVDQIFDEQELVIKPFSAALQSPGYLYGCAILGDGTLVPVIDGSVLIRNWNGSPEKLALNTAAPAQIQKKSVLSAHIPTILVIDDSLTARGTLTLTLQKFGYQVVQAGDGREGLDKLHQEADIKAVFCDVEMPTMNGFEFLSASRKEFPANKLPIIMLTSRSGDKHRGIAKLLGANHYLTKPYLEQDLIQTLQTCLEPVQV